MNQLEKATSAAVRAARARTGCDCISAGPMVFGRPDLSIPTLVVYRPSGSSIVMAMHDAIPNAQFVQFMNRLTREEVRQRVVLEAQKLTADAGEYERVGNAKKADRARKDAVVLGDYAKTIPSDYAAKE